MKIIEALKQIKILTMKAEDYRSKISKYCADLDYETPQYPDQRERVQGWLQGHSDILGEILRLKKCIAHTNLATKVTVELGGNEVTKTITEWIYRRRELAAMDAAAWSALTDRKLKDGVLQQSDGTTREIKIRRYFSKAERDSKVELYRNEPHLIDAKLEIANATIDLIED